MDSTTKFTFNPKEGIINPGMVITDDIGKTPSPHLCVLKREEYETYGFKLRWEKHHRGHVIRDVESNGLAGRSGLQDGDVLLEVNNFFVDDLSHCEVARKINQSGNQLCLLVLGEKAYKEAVSQNQDLRDLSRAWREGCTPPRLCHLSRNPVSGLGINFTALEGNGSIGERGRFSVSLVAGGAADKAGVCKGDRLLWMNGATVSGLTHSALTKMMKKCDDLTILVIDIESEKNYIKKRMPILPPMAVPLNLPHRSRKLHLVSGPESYGFLLRQEVFPSGREYHVLRGVESDSPAEVAGMKNGELLLEVNEELVEKLQHHEIVDRVRNSGKQMSLTTISYAGLHFYTKLGLSPLLFCEDITGKDEDKHVGAFPGKQLPKEKDGLSNARLCSLVKGPLGFGFDLGSEPNCPGTFIRKVVPDGSAERAGLVEGNVVIEVDGQNVERKYLEEVIMLMKDKGCLSLLIKDETTYDKKKKSDNLTSVALDEDEELTFL